MKLYELTTELQALFDSLEEATDEETGEIQQQWFDNFKNIQDEFENKAECIAIYIKSLKSESDLIAAEEKALKSRKEQKLRQIDRLKKYLLSSMTSSEIFKIDKPRAKILIRNNAESVVIDDEQKFIDWAETYDESLLRYKSPEINKTEIKKMLQSGEHDLPCCRLVRTQSLMIK